jgi:hypothetical protein
VSTPKDGGPAFPCLRELDGGIYETGMSLLDWFAAHETLSEWDSGDAIMSDKMATALAGEPKPEGGWGGDPLAMLKWEAKARSALKYIRAEAMLAEHERRST